MKRLEKGDQRRGLRGIQVLSVRGHIAAALQNLAHQLIRRQSDGDCIKGRSAFATEFTQRVAVMALLRLENERSLNL